MRNLAIRSSDVLPRHPLTEGQGEVPQARGAQALSCFERLLLTEGQGERRPWRRWRRYTYADYKKWDDDVRREIIGGSVYMMSAPTVEHQGISGELFRQFANYLVGKSCRVFAAPLDVRLFAPAESEVDDESDTDVVQPDIVVVCDRAKLHREGCRGAPDLAVEILSESNRSHDTLLKFNKYLEAGVREYWVVDPSDKTLYVHTLIKTAEGNHYQTAAYDADAEVKVNILEGCSIKMNEVFGALGAFHPGL
jgi:Uma2 family endonuclease